MRRFIPWFIVAGFTAIFGISILFTVLLATPNGARIRSPDGMTTLDRTFVVSGDAWMKEGTVSVTVVATSAAGDVRRYDAERDTVRDRGRPLFSLSTWQARITLPSDGKWELRASVTGSRGGGTESAPRAIAVQAGAPEREFRSWTPEHLAPLLVIVVFAIALGMLARSLSAQAAAPGPAPGVQRLIIVLAAAMWLNEVVYQTYWFLIGGWSAPASLIVQMCGLSILFLPVAGLVESQRARQILFDVLYFWGIGGAAQALIAPDLGANGFPAYRYFSFFLSHSLIIALTVVIAMGARVKITIRSYVRALVLSNLVLIPMYGFDRLLALIPPYDPGNYFVLGYPPPTGSIVDIFAAVFGPAPRYVIGLEIMGIVIFAILWLPWPIARAIRSRRRKASAAIT